MDLLVASKNIADSSKTIRIDLDTFIMSNLNNILDSINPPITSEVNYIQRVKSGYIKYFDVIDFLEWEKKSLENRLILLQKKVAWGKMVEKSILETFKANREDFIAKSKAFTDSLINFIQVVVPNKNHKEYIFITRKKEELEYRANILSRFEKDMDKNVEKLLSDNKKLDIPELKTPWNIKQVTPNTTPASNGPTLAVNNPTSATPGTTPVNKAPASNGPTLAVNNPTSATSGTIPVNKAPVSNGPTIVTTVNAVPTITDDFILNKLKETLPKSIEIRKTDDKELYAAYEKFLADPDTKKNYNLVPVDKKKIIAISGVFDKTNNTWIWQAPTA